ncbi:hypothetical protein FHY55_19475 [Oceanicola sp. D3]|uniref:DUF7697 family protein n=1 Tax=Oceanicola sp. D3 TaxID=2587163 RepID=UPI00111F11FA|nr:hypothetical protein [Oceanicola sp. D3]QDC11280.1 hypothetical protein FHY55_19475 [Oceanicola sp. D3]
MAPRILGYDLTAALAMADALGLNRLAVTEFLPQIEREMVAALNDTESPGDDEWQSKSQSD